jgi:ATP-dependent RNA helicase RhlE
MEKPTFIDFDLPKQLNSALEKLGISEPTPIQLKSFSPIMSGKDVMELLKLVQNLAYLLPVLKTWKFNKNGSPTVLVLVPT